MKFITPKIALATLVFTATAIAQAPVTAAPVSITVNGTFTDAPDALTSGANIFNPLMIGLGFSSTFSYDTTGGTINTEFAAPADGGTGEEFGTEFTGGSATPIIPALPVTPPDTNTYTSPTLIVEMENNVTRTPADLLNLLPGGTYDFFSVNGWEPSSTFSGGSTIGEGGAIDGINFGLAFIDVDATLFSGPLTPTDMMPETIDISLVDYVIVVLEEYEDSELVGFAYQFGTIAEGGTFNNFTIVSETSEVPEPAMPLVLGIGLLALFAARRKKRAA